MRIAFIGLGNMGAPMARNLAAAGHSVTGVDLASVEIDGVSMASSIAGAASGVDVAITMLPDGGALRAVAEELIPALTAPACWIDCSTVDIAACRDVHSTAKAAGLHALDAPVSGGVGGAEAGTLTFMCGGSEDAFATAQPLFDIMGAKAVHCGAGGAGQAAKICNNMILGATMIVTCEAFALADRLGLDRQAMFDVVSTSSGASWSVNTYCPAPGIGPEAPSDRNYAPGFATELMAKDLALAEAAAEEVGSQILIGRRAAEIYRTFLGHGGAGKDFSAVLQMLEEASPAEN